MLAGAHHRLLLSRPPPRRTVRTLLEKQNWGVRHRGYPAVPPQPRVAEGPLQGRGPLAWRDKFGARGAALGTHLLWGLQGKSLLTDRDPRNAIRLMTTGFCPFPRSEEAAETQRPRAGSGACANAMHTGRPSAPGALRSAAGSWLTLLPALDLRSHPRCWVRVHALQRVGKPYTGPLPPKLPKAHATPLL